MAYSASFRSKWSAVVIAGAGTAGVLLASNEASQRKSPLMPAGHASGFARRFYPPGDDYPDFTNHHSIMAKQLSSRLYCKLRDLTTRNGVILDHCIQTGVDNPGHPMIRTTGIVAGDMESYSVFAELFDKVIAKRHSGYIRSENVHPTDLDYTRVRNGNLEPEYVVSVRIRTVRNLNEFCLPPACGRAERRHIEGVVSRSLRSLSGELKGRFYPIRFIPSAEQSEWLEAGLSFNRPSTSVHLASGLARDWPDGRGVFLNHDRSFAVWINECEDHLKVISIQSGGNLREVFRRYCLGLNAIEEELRKHGQTFMYDQHLGYISTCPSNLGTGMRASVYIRLPRLSKDPRFSAIVRRLNMSKRKVPGETDIFDISNTERLGISEVALINQLVDGLHRLIKLEKCVESGKPIDSLIPN